MKKIAIFIVVAIIFASLLALAVATPTVVRKFYAQSPADYIGEEVKIYLKEWAAGAPYIESVYAEGTLIKVTLKFYILESDDLYSLIPVDNTALIEVAK